MKLLVPILIIVAAVSLGAAIGRYRDGGRDRALAGLLIVGLASLGYLIAAMLDMSRHDLQSIAPLVMFVASYTIVIQLLRVPQTREGRCPQCGYLLHELETSRCPECGIDIMRGLQTIPRRRALILAGTSATIWLVAVAVCQVVPQYTQWGHHVTFNDRGGFGHLTVAARTTEWIPPWSDPSAPTTKPRTFEIRITPLNEHGHLAATSETTLSRADTSDETIARTVRTALPDVPDEIADRVTATVSACIAADCRDQSKLEASLATVGGFPSNGIGTGRGRVFEAYLLVIAAAALLWVLLVARFRSRLVRAAGV